MGCFHAGVILFPRTIPSGELGIRPQSGLSFGIDVFLTQHCSLSIVPTGYSVISSCSLFGTRLNCLIRLIAVGVEQLDGRTMLQLHVTYIWEL